MDLEKKLQAAFPKVNQVFFEEEYGVMFLRVEVDLIKLADVELESRAISNFLDENYQSSQEYFLDVYSKGSDINFEFDQASQHLEQDIKVDLVNTKEFLIGKLKNVDSQKIEIWVNNKGQIKKQIIDKGQVKNLSIFIKI